MKGIVYVTEPSVIYADLGGPSEDPSGETSIPFGTGVAIESDNTVIKDGQLYFRSLQPESGWLEVRGISSHPVGGDTLPEVCEGQIATVRGYVHTYPNGRGHTHHAHQRRWKRVLIAMGAHPPIQGAPPMTAAEAQRFYDRTTDAGKERWGPVVECLTSIEAQEGE